MLSKKQINLRLYDIDSCLFDSHIPNTEAIESWLIQKNNDFFAQQIKDILNNQYAEVILGYGTNRQSYQIDNLSKARGFSCSPVLPIIQSHFAKEIKTPIFIDPFLMSDLYAKELQAGDSYKAILRTHQGSKNEKHADWVADLYKISLLYAHIHRIACLYEANPETEITVDFYDDQVFILSNIKYFYSQYPILLPKNVKLKLHQYDCENKKIHDVLPITGEGNPDRQYDWSVRYLAATCTYITDESGFVQNNIYTAEHLKNYHESNQYKNYIHNKYHYPVMNVKDNFNMEKFKRFHNSEISELVSNKKITELKNYTTAHELYDKNLIPEKYLAQKVYRNFNLQPFKIENNKENSTVISKELHEKIKYELSKYVSSRANFLYDIKDNKIKLQLNWTTKYFRNSNLTKEKIKSAMFFMKVLDNDKLTISEITRSYNTCLNRNTNSERSHVKKYFFFRKSDLSKRLKNIQIAMDKENKLKQ